MNKRSQQWNVERYQKFASIVPQLGRVNHMHFEEGWNTCLMLLFGVLFIMIPQAAFASSVTNSSPMSNALCIAATWITGDSARARATIAVAILGIGALLGKISWGIALLVGVGISVVFGATTIVQLLGGTSSAMGGTGTTNCT